MIDADYRAWLDGVLRQAKLEPYLGDDVLGLVLRSDKIVRAGTWAEFGVASGNSLRRLARLRGDAQVWGFDTFTGLPEDWRLTGAVHLKGAFAQDSIPNIPGAHIVSGLFQDTLPAWQPRAPITLLHIDCDLYSSTRCVFDHVLTRLAPGAIIVFDELLEYPGFEEHEMRALYEVTQGGLGWDFLHVGGEKVAIQVRS